MSASFACEKAIYKGAHNGGVIPSALGSECDSAPLLVCSNSDTRPSVFLEESESSTKINAHACRAPI
jgi:hypothetical protein